MTPVLEEVGAGEGNRTLVISLEGIWRSCNFNAHSDIAVQFAPLSRHANSALSERIQLASSQNSGTADGRPLASSRVPEDLAPMLPNGKDPDEYVREHGLDAWRAHIGQVEHSFRYLARSARRADDEIPFN
jgi:hypothetical protein